MSTSSFQTILRELKSRIPFTLGVVDGEGKVLSCTDPRLINEHIPAAVAFFESGRQDGEHSGYLFHVMLRDGLFKQAVFANEVSEAADAVCTMAVIAMNSTRATSSDKQDKMTFIKKIVLDNIMSADIYTEAREMNFANSAKRVVYLIRVEDKRDAIVVEILNKLYPDRQKDYPISINESEVVLVKEMRTGDDREAVAVAKEMDAAFFGEVGSRYVIGIGSCVNQLKDIAKSYKEAQIAVEIGRVFDEEKTVMNFENLGIGRLIYQLPTTLCEMFLSEIFRKGSIDSLDEETLFTIQKFFENNLNISEASRKLFVHRNTLVYRLEKIKKLTGLDLREFDDAIVLKVALMVKKYLRSRENMG